MGLGRRNGDQKFHNQDSMWTSYSDLFLGLSVIFLLLYVTASLRQGTDGIKQHIQNDMLTKENEDLKQQMKVYNSLKQNYVDTEASKDEQQTYKMLMEKLNLLKDDASQEKTKLEKQAMENAQKEQALNQYQQIVRNIINANIIAKSRIKNRDSLITKKEGAIEDQNKEITEQQNEITDQRSEIEKDEGEITQSKQKMSTLEQQIGQMKSDFASQKIAEKKRFEAQLSKARISAAERAKREAKFRAESDKKAKDLAQRVAAAEAQYESTKGALDRTKADLANAQENLNARKKVAENIKNKFQANGVQAEVDGKTGDVLLSFEGEYFDTGASQLKPKMRQVLERAMPAYAASLFQDRNIAEKLENVEIVGFASPTFKGKYVDPATVSAKDRAAVNFNLDLSYSRARAIFDHMLTKMEFEHKQRLLPLIKVTGRSFLSGKSDRDPANNSLSEFCKKHDCAKQQTVIIKFKLKD